MWPFNKKNKKNKKDEVLDIKLREFSEREAIELKKHYQGILDRWNKIGEEGEKKDKEKVDNENSICPKCESTNIIDNIKREQGKIKGSSFASGYGGGLFGGSFSSSSSSIDGEWDTNEVNICKDCDHEWKKSKTCQHAGRIWCTVELGVRFSMQAWKEALVCTLDLQNMEEKYNSLEEKRKGELERLNNNFAIKIARELFEGFAFEAVLQICKKHMDGYVWKRFAKNYDQEIFMEIFKLKSIDEYVN